MRSWQSAVDAPVLTEKNEKIEKGINQLANSKHLDLETKPLSMTLIAKAKRSGSTRFCHHSQVVCDLWRCIAQSFHQVTSARV